MRFQLFHKCSKHKISFGQFLMKCYSGDSYLFLSLTLAGIKISCSFRLLCRSTLFYTSKLFVLPNVIFCRWHFTAFCVCCYNNWHSNQDNWLCLSQSNQNTPFQLSFLFLAQTDQWLLSFAERMQHIWLILSDWYLTFYNH